MARSRARSRAGKPADERLSFQLNVRTTRGLKSRLDATARRLGLRDGSRLVRGGIVLALERPREALEAEARANRPAASRGSSSAGDPVSEPALVHLPDVLSGWTGLPRSLTRGFLLSGRVTVDGVVPGGLDVPLPERERVRLDGRPV